MAVLDGIGGLDTLLLATATVLAGLYTWAAHRFLRAACTASRLCSSSC